MGRAVACFLSSLFRHGLMTSWRGGIGWLNGRVVGGWILWDVSRCVRAWVGAFCEVRVGVWSIESARLLMWESDAEVYRLAPRFLAIDGFL